MQLTYEPSFGPYRLALFQKRRNPFVKILRLASLHAEFDRLSDCCIEPDLILRRQQPLGTA